MTQKVRLKYKESAGTYSSLWPSTNSDVVIRDTNNVPIAGTNATQVLQTMANLFFPVWGGTQKTVIAPDSVGWMAAAQNLTSPNCIVVINATDNSSEPTSYAKFTLNGGATWQSIPVTPDNPQGPELFLYQSRMCSLYTDDNNNHNLIIIGADGNGSDVSTKGGCSKFVITPLGSVTRENMSSIGTNAGSQYELICSTPINTVVMNKAGTKTFINARGATTWTVGASVSSGISEMRGMIFNPVIGKIVSIGGIQGATSAESSTTYRISPNNTGTGTWTIYAPSYGTYGVGLDVTCDDQGATYLLFEKKIGILPPWQLSLTYAPSYDIPTPPTGETWHRVLVKDDTIMIIGNKGSIVTIPVTQIASGTWKWRVISAASETVARYSVFGVGGRLIIGHSSGTVGGVSGRYSVNISYSAPPSTLK